MEPLYIHLTRVLRRALFYEKIGNSEPAERNRNEIDEFVAFEMPSGLAFDTGTHFDHKASTINKLVFNVNYHHSDDDGVETGKVSALKVTVKPDLVWSVTTTVSGRVKNWVKEYVHEEFMNALDKHENWEQKSVDMDFRS